MARRHEPRLVVGLSGSSEPDRPRADFSRMLVSPTHSRQQGRVNLTDQMQGKRHTAANLFQTMFDRSDVVADLGGVGGVFNLIGLHFKQEKLVQAGHRALDSTGQHGFAAEEGPDEEVWVGEHPPKARKFPKRSICLRYPLQQRKVDGQRGRQPIGLECPVAEDGTADLPWRLGGELFWQQVPASVRLWAYLPERQSSAINLPFLAKR